MGKCLNPYYLRDMELQTPVPCGKCPECKKRRASAWSFRLMKEYERAESGSFVTLTYDNDNIPLSKNGFMTLNKRDLQLFFKRLRKLHGESNIKYYAVGEYGENFKRPHYHIILFNANIELIHKAWKLGHVHIGTLTEASVGYTLKYMCKEKSTKLFARDDRAPEKSYMSKGLGENYLTPQMIQWHKNKPTERVYAVTSDSKKIALPRYYRNKIYNQEEAVLIQKSAHQQSEIQKEMEWQEYGINLASMKKQKLEYATEIAYKRNKNRKF